RFAELVLGFGHLARASQRDAHVVVAFGVIWAQSHGSIEQFNAVGYLPALHERIAEIVEGLDTIAPLGDRRLQFFDRFGQAAGGRQCVAEVVMRLEIVWLSRK